MPEVQPRVTPDFEWQTTAVGRALLSTTLAPIASHVFSSRDASPPGVHQPDYDAVARSLGVDTAQVVRVRQVHGREVLIVREGEALDAEAAADAVVSFDPERAVLVRVADCVPILLADRHRRVVAAVHAGWRGTAAGVVSAAIEAIEAAGIPASDLVAAIGPSIGPCCYQVDATVRGDFARRWAKSDDWFTPDGPDRWRLDLWRANRAQLEEAGVPTGAISVASACTADAPNLWYSHRRQGAAAGRMVAAIRLTA
jgi:YfiH family protein